MDSDEYRKLFEAAPGSKPSPLFCIHSDEHRIPDPEAEVAGDGLCERCGTYIREPEIRRDWRRMEESWFRQGHIDRFPPLA